MTNWFLRDRSIIRILLMVPIYSLVAWLSIYFHKHAVYYSVMGDCYEAFTISAFFALMCHYIAPDLHSQKNYFRGIKPKQWVWPLNWMQKCCGGEHGIWRIPRSGLTWFNVRSILHTLMDWFQEQRLIFWCRSFGSASSNTVFCGCS